MVRQPGRARRDAAALTSNSLSGFARRLSRLLGDGSNPTGGRAREAEAGQTLPEGWVRVTPDEDWREFDVSDKGDAIEISALMAAPDPGSERSVVARVRLFNSQGETLNDRLGGLRMSSAAGRYFYPLEYVRNGAFRFALKLPSGAARLEIAIQVWRRSDPTPYSYGELSIRPTGLNAAINVRETTAQAGRTPEEQRKLAEKEVRFALRKYANRLLNTAAPLYADEAPFGEPLVEYLAHVEQSSVVAERLAIRRLRAGRDLEALALADLAKLSPLERAHGRRQLHGWADRWLDRELPAPGVSYQSLVYLMHNCPPFDSGGYAGRAHGLLRGFQKAGWTVHPFARPGYPADKGKGSASVVEETVDDVTYNFLPDEGSVDDRDQVAYVERYAAHVLARLGDQPVGYVQAASFFQNAFAGRLIADKLGVPLVYEMRGMDWLTRGSSDPRWLGSPQETIARELEIKAAKSADRVLAITQALKEWLVAQGVEADRIGVLPNGCSPDLFEIAEPDAELREELDLPEASVVVGYVGSIVAYEGVTELMEGVHLARELSGRDIRLLVVGDGLALPDLRLKVAELDAGEWVMMTGRVPHADVPRYYSLIDVVGLTRRDQPVTRMISPLKPLEALASGKPVIATHVAALREIVGSAPGGVIVPNNANHALAHAIIDVAEARDNSGPEARLAEAEARRNWAERERDWAVLAANALDEIQRTFPAAPRVRLGSRRAS